MASHEDSNIVIGPNSRNDAEKELQWTLISLTERVKRWKHSVKELSIISVTCYTLEQLIRGLDKYAKAEKETREQLTKLAAEFRGLQAKAVLYVKGVNSLAAETNRACTHMRDGRWETKKFIAVMMAHVDVVKLDMNFLVERYSEILEHVSIVQTEATDSAEKAFLQTRDATLCATPGLAVVGAPLLAAGAVKHPVGKVVAAGASALGGILITILQPLSGPIGFLVIKHFADVTKKWQMLSKSLDDVKRQMTENKETVISVAHLVGMVCGKVREVKNLEELEEPVDEELCDLARICGDLSTSCERFLELSDSSSIEFDRAVLGEEVSS